MSWARLWAWVSGQNSASDLRIRALVVESENFSRALQAEKQIVANLQVQLELSRARKISAEAIASERKEEILRLIQELSSARETLQTVQGERLRSLDSLNLKLLNPRSAETPDLAVFKALQEKAYDEGSREGSKLAVIGAVRSLKAQSSAVDRALLEKLHPRFQRPSDPNGHP